MANLSFIENGSKIISEKIESAISSGQGQLIVSGNYEIEKEIVLPSNFTIILEDCHLRLKDGVFCNIFTNRVLASGEKSFSNSDKNIKIIGRGKAILDGGNHNGVIERNSKEKGIPTWKNRLILFYNVDGFSITGLHICNQRHWATSFFCCRNGRIAEIDFRANDYAMYYEGKKDFTMDYLTMWSRNGAHWRNGDGIDINHGCHDLIIENITGYTDDDTIALANVMPCGYAWMQNGAPVDVYNIVIRNVNSSSWCSNIRILCQGGSKLYNVLIDGMIDSSKDSECMTRGVYGVNIGDSRLYGARHATPEEVYNITVKNVYSRAEKAVRIAGSVKNLRLENVSLFDGGEVKIYNDNAILVDSKIEE